MPELSVMVSWTLSGSVDLLNSYQTVVNASLIGDLVALIVGRVKKFAAENKRQFTSFNSRDRSRD